MRESELQGSALLCMKQITRLKKEIENRKLASNNDKVSAYFSAQSDKPFQIDVEGKTVASFAYNEQKEFCLKYQELCKEHPNKKPMRFKKGVRG